MIKKNPTKMKPINAIEKWFSKIFLPSMDKANIKKNLSEDQRFRILFKKRKSTLILVLVILWLITFGIARSFSFITLLIACSPFIVIFWGSFGEQLMGVFKLRKNKK